MKRIDLSKQFIVIPGWAPTKLNLKGNELLLFSLIYGFTQDNKSKFNGSLKYMAEWLGVQSVKTVTNTLNSLVEKELIIKIDVNQDTNAMGYYTKPNEYYVNFKEVSRLLDEVTNTDEFVEEDSLDITEEAVKISSPVVNNTSSVVNNTANSIDNNIDNNIGPTVPVGAESDTSNKNVSVMTNNSDTLKQTEEKLIPSAFDILVKKKIHDTSKLKKNEIVALMFDSSSLVFKNYPNILETIKRYVSVRVRTRKVTTIESYLSLLDKLVSMCSDDKGLNETMCIDSINLSISGNQDGIFVDFYIPSYYENKPDRKFNNVRKPLNHFDNTRNNPTIPKKDVLDLADEVY